MTKKRVYQGKIITRKEMVEQFGIDLNHINTIARFQLGNMPKPIGRMAHCEYAYDYNEIKKWLKKVNIPELVHSLFKRQRQAGRMPNAAEKTGLDNAMALKFITGKIGKIHATTNKNRDA